MTDEEILYNYCEREFGQFKCWREDPGFKPAVSKTLGYTGYRLGVRVEEFWSSLKAQLCSLIANKSQK